jgi:hypothetical protein
MSFTPVGIPATKVAIKAFFGAMLKRHEIGDKISGPDENHLLRLIQQHPDYAIKIGCGIVGFTVVPSLFGSKCFAVVRADGTTCDFSYRECVSPSTAHAEVLAAMRHEVADDIQAAKVRYFDEHGDEFGRINCRLTGELINISQAHADHAPPRTFNELAVGYLEAREIVADKSLLTPPEDNQFGRRLRIPAMAKDWRRFHHKQAYVRLVSAAANLARSQEGRPRAEDRQLILVGEDE